jgi:hypothetical protein
VVVYVQWSDQVKLFAIWQDSINVNLGHGLCPIHDINQWFNLQVVLCKLSLY